MDGGGVFFGGLLEDEGHGLAWHFYAAKDALEGAISVEAFDFGFGLEDYTVAHHGGHEDLDVVGDDVGAALQGGESFACLEEGDSGAGGATQREVGRAPAFFYDALYVV